MKRFLVLILVTQTGLAGVYTKSLWRENQIEVCFAKGETFEREIGKQMIKPRDWSESNKTKIKKWVNEEFNVSRTGIHFVGWKNCSDAPFARVIMFYNRNSAILNKLNGGLEGVTHKIGPAFSTIDGYSEAFNGVAISKSGLNKGVVVHEFGHISGLAHEHNHPDAAKNGRGCVYISPVFVQSLEYESYDANSVMSYCTIKKDKHAGLSSRDVALLRKLYLKTR
jgi:hypothetical protein